MNFLRIRKTQATNKICMCSFAISSEIFRENLADLYIVDQSKFLASVFKYFWYQSEARIPLLLLFFSKKEIWVRGEIYLQKNLPKCVKYKTQSSSWTNNLYFPNRLLVIGVLLCIMYNVHSGMLSEAIYIQILFHLNHTCKEI